MVKVEIHHIVKIQVDQKYSLSEAYTITYSSSYCSFFSFTAAEQVKLVCYHTNWAYYRNPPVNFTPTDIDPHMCTHIIYSFARVDKTTFRIEPYDENDIDGEGYYLVSVCETGVNIVSI